MSPRVSAPPYGEVARKWCDLAERRCAHFVDLHRSGRWRHYYDKDEFMLRMREALNAADTWARLANRPVERLLAAE